MKIMPRRLQALGKGAPTVESSLDDFISRANEDSVDVSDFDKAKQEAREAAVQRDTAAKTDGEQRELALHRRVEELEQRIVALKAKRRPSQGWGKLVIGFVLGCGSMFAVSALMPRDSAQPATTANAPAPAAAPVQAAPPAPPLAVTPIEEPAVPPAPPAATPAVAPPAAPSAPAAAAQPVPVAEPAPAAEPAAVATKRAVEKPAKPAKKARRIAPSQSQPAQPAPSPPAPDPKSGKEGLYNPF